MFDNIPSLSRLLDIHLEVDVVEGTPSTCEHMKSLTFSLPTDEYTKLSGGEMERLYFRPIMKAIGEAINKLGPVRTAAIPLPKDEVAFQCTNGRIPVLLRVVRRSNPDRHQFLIHALVEPVCEPSTESENENNGEE